MLLLILLSQLLQLTLLNGQLIPPSSAGFEPEFQLKEDREVGEGGLSGGGHPLKGRHLKLLFGLTFGTKSHMSSLLNIGKVLKSRGHILNYFSPIQLQGYITKTDNFTKFRVGPEDLDVINKSGKFSSKSITYNSIDKGQIQVNVPSDPKVQSLQVFESTIPKTYQLCFQDILSVIKEVEPDVILCDFLSLPCIEAAQYLNIPVVIMFQTLDGPLQTPPYITTRMYNYPTTTDTLNYFQRVYSTLIYPLSMLPKLVRINSKLNGVRDELNKRLKINLNKRGLKDPWGWNNCLKLINSFVGFELAREFDQTWNFVGPIVDHNFDDVLDVTVITFLKGKSKVLYLAFGTLISLSRSDIHLLLETLNQLLTNKVIDGVIWSTDATDFIDLEIDSNKIFVKSKVAQTQILNDTRIKLFLTHGGLASIFEGMYYATKMLVFPKFGDQFRNGRKVLELGLGNTFENQLTNQSDKIKFLYKMLVDILVDKDQFINTNLRKWQTLVRFNDRRVKAADLIEMYGYTNLLCKNNMRLNNEQSDNKLRTCGIQHLLPPTKPILLGWDLDVLIVALCLVLLTTYLCRIISLYVIKLLVGKYRSMVKDKKSMDKLN